MAAKQAINLGRSNPRTGAELSKIPQLRFFFAQALVVARYGANPTTSNYNATGSLARFKNYVFMYSTLETL
jgi:hypothetical protein